MTVCTFTIAQDTSGNREGAGKWLSNSLVQVLLGGGGSLAAAAAVPPALPPSPPSPSPPSPPPPPLVKITQMN